MALDPELLEILVCPKSRQPLREEGDWLICDASGLKYPVRDGIPVMLIDEAVPLDGASAADGEDGASA